MNTIEVRRQFYAAISGKFWYLLQFHKKINLNQFVYVLFAFDS